MLVKTKYSRLQKKVGLLQGETMAMLHYIYCAYFVLDKRLVTCEDQITTFILLRVYLWFIYKYTRRQKSLQSTRNIYCGLSGNCGSRCSGISGLNYTLPSSYIQCRKWTDYVFIRREKQNYICVFTEENLNNTVLEQPRFAYKNRFARFPWL